MHLFNEMIKINISLCKVQEILIACRLGNYYLPEPLSFSEYLWRYVFIYLQVPGCWLKITTS